jgi:hypothetical protein
LDVCPIDEPATWQRKQHGDVLPIPAILIAEHPHEVALFKLDGDQDVTGGRQ